MPTRTRDAEIDRLYQLPLDEFTAARNALAKAAGKDGSEIRSLTKPPVAAWAINQVYWRRRPLFDALSAAASGLRTAHSALAEGKRADLRAAGTAHEEALDAVLKAALEILAESGQPPTDATKQAISTTLRALPSPDDEPGRLSHVLQPRGFEMLAGLPSSAGAGKPAAREPATAREARPATARGSRTARTAGDEDRARKDAERTKTLAAAKEAVTAAARGERTAEQDARRIEFEAARSLREAERAKAKLEAARDALAAAQDAVDAAEEAAKAATRAADADARRVRESADALARARVKAEAAETALARLTR
jgi:hypothetical protein